ncbi:hypothetical protein JN11_01480 [Mucilaginibacter frigoritolerans]|uniref:Uncharacterized protein n=2 Tax=Mucilaginibacter frigoritolerans TaxID=652788 RepID=A0A562UAN4_9SPHI|nr:hypothetical protein JN11_01480 [Mucilaginibacter frigoritolerans]
MLCCIILCGTACKPDIKETGAALKYFDIKGYFSADIAHLNHLKIQVLKTVSHNGTTESKTVKIDNWGQEFNLFIDADINKPAWQKSYTVITDDSLLFYKAIDPELKMREMIIKRDNKQKVKWILIFNRTKNILYTTTEKLSYYPDSLYLIEKDQHVRLMGNNHYRIEGVIKH